MQQLLENRKKELIAICQALNIKRLYAFGSVVSESFRDDSDIDFLIAFADNLTVESINESKQLIYEA